MFFLITACLLPIPLRLGFLPSLKANRGQSVIMQFLTSLELPEEHSRQCLRIALSGERFFIVPTSGSAVSKIELKWSLLFAGFCICNDASGH